MNNEARTRSSSVSSRRATTDHPPLYNVRDAALIGAASAFSRSPGRTNPLVNNNTGDSRALAGATKAGRDRASNGHLRRISTPSMTDDDMDHLEHQSSLSDRSGPSSPSWSVMSNRPVLEVPHMATSRSTSPSNIAAVLAAARHTPKPSGDASTRSSASQGPAQDRMAKPGTVRNIRSQFDDGSDVAGSSRAIAQDRRKDNTGGISSPSSRERPRATMIGRNNDGTRSVPPLESHGARPPLRSPKPQRKIALIEDQTGVRAMDDIHSEIDAGTAILKEVPKPPRKPSTHVSQELATTSKVSGNETSSPKPEVGQKPPTITKPPVERPITPKQPRQSLHIESQAKPDLPPPRRTAKKVSPPNEVVRNIVKDDPSTNLSPGAIGLQTGPRTPMVEPTKRAGPISPSPRSIHSQRPPNQKPNVSSLANAMVGAAVAASRNPTPSSSPPPPLPRRHNNHNHHFPFPRHKSRNPSPERPTQTKLRSTMRRGPSSAGSSDSDEEGRGKHGRGRRHFVRKHPNKHHEGSRKRWRDQVMERERKRYEGVWAANKGSQVLNSHGSGGGVQKNITGINGPENEVLNVAVREIWGRSRLPADVLAEVWELVDSRQIGCLTREEFVVGMWLVDQRLKGRKLPPSVSDSVWSSVRGWGVKVHNVKRKH